MKSRISFVFFSFSEARAGGSHQLVTARTQVVLYAMAASNMTKSNQKNLDTCGLAQAFAGGLGLGVSAQPVAAAVS
jgi:hypothetical protein